MDIGEPYPIMRAAAVLMYRPSPRGFSGTGETGKLNSGGATGGASELGAGAETAEGTAGAVWEDMSLGCPRKEGEARRVGAGVGQL